MLDSIDRLQQESGLYRRMTEHGAKRAQAFDVNMLTQKWISLLEEARERNRRETLHPVMLFAIFGTARRSTLEKGCLAGGIEAHCGHIGSPNP